MNRIISEDYADLIVNNEIVPLYTQRNDVGVTQINDKHSLLNIPASEFDKCSLGTYNYSFFPTCFTLMSTASLDESSVTQIQKNPNFALFGQGILVGIVDTGIEYQHQAFVGSDNTSKITVIWDQTITDENNTESEVPYGTIYDNSMINAALASSNPLSVVPSTDEIGHGTILAGIAAGNTNEGQSFSGVVPQAELVVVKLKQAKRITREIFGISQTSVVYQDTDILMGLRFLVTVASRLQRPLSICFGLGSSQGGHDGLGPVSSYLDLLSQTPKLAFSIAAGNEGISRRHFLGTVARNEPTREFELNISASDQSLFMEIWQPAPYRIALDITSPTGEYTAPIFPSTSDCRKLSYIFESSVLWVNNILVEGDTGDQLILVRFQAPQSGIWRFKVYNVDNAAFEFNAWLPSGDLISNETYFLQSNPDITLTSPANSIRPMTITSYDIETDGIQISASRGYTRINIVKPDLAAPGVNITCAKIGNTYGTASGTSCAAAHNAGIAAMMLEWGILKGNYISMNSVDIKKLLIRGANRSNDMSYPNNVWGYGRVNIYNVFQRIR